MEELFSALSGALAQERKLEIITNNLANINTPGYKRDVAIFQTILRGATHSSEGSSNHTAETSSLGTLYNPAFVDLIGIQKDFSSGNLERTGNKMDFSIQGEGFFKIQTPQGTRYSRNGSFMINTRGELALNEDHVVLGTGGRISLNNAQFDVSPQGEIIVDGAVVDSLKIVDFDEPQKLVKVGNSEFANPDDSIRERDAVDYRIHQAFVERSNVEPVRELIEMITVQRAYQAYEKAIKTSYEMTDRLLSEAAR